MVAKLRKISMPILVAEILSFVLSPARIGRAKHLPCAVVCVVSHSPGASRTLLLLLEPCRIIRDSAGPLAALRVLRCFNCPLNLARSFGLCCILPEAACRTRTGGRSSIGHRLYNVGVDHFHLLAGFLGLGRVLVCADSTRSCVYVCGGVLLFPGLISKRKPRPLSSDMAGSYSVFDTSKNQSQAN